MGEVNNNKPKARLENWFMGPNDLLYGNVYGHPSIPDGKEVITSRVVTLDKKSGIAMTKNTCYQLGNPAADGDND